MIKMIAIDLDGTLLSDDKNISDYSLSILEKCKSKGLKIAFATARTEREAERLSKQADPDFQILNGGALVIKRNREVIYKSQLSVEMSNAIINECLKESGIINLSVITDEFHYRRVKPSSNHPDYSKWTYNDYSKPLSTETYSIDIKTLNPDIANKIENNFKDINIIKVTDVNAYRILHKDADKMAGVKAIAEEEKIALNEIAAFGDDYSDMRMLRECGTGIAMENGIAEIKKIAGYVCKSNNNDGVAKWIEEYLL